MKIEKEKPLIFSNIDEVTETNKSAKLVKNNLYVNEISDYIYEDIGASLNFPLDNLESLDGAKEIPSKGVLPTDRFTGIKKIILGGILTPVSVDRGWIRVFSHNSSMDTNRFSGVSEAKWCNSTDPMSSKYSILKELEQFRNKDNTFLFKLRYPELVGEVESFTNYWKQTSNPTHEALVGYEPIRIGYNGNHWGGLEYNGGSTLCDGSINHSNWYHSVGQISSYNGNPGPGVVVQKTELWVQCDNLGNLIFDEEGCWVGTAYENFVKNATSKTTGPYSSTGWDESKHLDALTVTGWSSGNNTGVPDNLVGYHAKWTQNAGYGDSRTASVEYNEDGGGRWLGVSSYLRYGKYTDPRYNIAVDDTLHLSAYHMSNRSGIRRACHIGNYHKALSSGNNHFGSTMCTMNNTANGIWERSGHSYVIDSNWDTSSTVNKIYSYGDNSGSVGQSWATNFQITKGEFQRPFIEDKNGASSLTIDITDLTGKTWNDNWTITYWKKPMGTSDDTMDGNSFERVLQGSNKYIVGKSISGDRYISSHKGSTSSTTNFEGEYFGRWQLIVISKKGLTLTTRCAYPIDHIYSTTISNTSDSIIFKTGYADNASSTNAYYKDFLFFDKALEEDDIKLIYARKAKLSNSQFSTLNGVIEA